MKRGGKRRREKGKINSLIMSFFIYLFFMFFFLEMHAINHFYFVYLKIFIFMWMETIDHSWIWKRLLSDKITLNPDI